MQDCLADAYISATFSLHWGTTSARDGSDLQKSVLLSFDWQG